MWEWASTRHQITEAFIEKRARAEQGYDRLLCRPCERRSFDGEAAHCEPRDLEPDLWKIQIPWMIKRATGLVE